MATRILLVDDHELFREGLARILEGEVDLQVSGQAGNGREALQALRKTPAEVVLMDISMPDMNGIDATRNLLADHPQVKVIALSMHAENQFVVEMLKAGARGYLLKDCAGRELLIAIREVLNDRMYLSSEISSTVLQDYLRLLQTEDGPEDQLSPREREVLQLLAEGKTTREIAERLFISVKTVETHRSRIMEKLDVHSVAELTKHALRMGLTSL